MIMQTAPELIFHDVDRSAWVESYILERVQRLERFADGITSCRVTLTQEQASHHKGNRYSVMVETRMPPNHDLAAKIKDRSVPVTADGTISLPFIGRLQAAGLT